MTKTVFYIECVIQWFVPGKCFYDVVTNAGTSRFCPADGSALPALAIDFIAKSESIDNAVIKMPGVHVFYSNSVGGAPNG